MTSLPAEQRVHFHSYPAYVTSREVWAVLHAAHQNLKHFGSFSDPTGTFNGGPATEGRMETSYGLPGADLPLIGVSTRWDIDPADTAKRVNERSTFYLFAHDYREE
jgi:hypothetical protein